jgi:hypothetical protein
MIITMSVLSDNVQSDGRRSIRFKFAWDGGELQQEFLLANDFDITAREAELIENVREVLKNQELNRLPKLVMENKTITEILSGLVFITQGQAVAKALQYGATETDINMLAGMQSVYDYLALEYTSAELAALTGLSSQYIVDSLERIRLVVNVKGTVDLIEELRTDG